MPIIIKENQALNGRYYKIPKDIKTKLSQTLARYKQYGQTDGYKKLNKLVNPNYNKRSNNTRKDGYVSFGELKKIKHFFDHNKENNLEYEMNGGDEMKQFANDTLNRERTSVKQVLAKKKSDAISKSNLQPVKHNKINIREDFEVVESIINEQINKFVGALVSESRESKNIAQAKSYIRANHQYVDARDVIKKIEHDIPNVRLMKYNYIKGVSRLFIDGQLSDASYIMKMNKYLFVISRTEELQKKLDQQLNNMSFYQLEELIDPIAKKMLADDMENLSKKKYSVNSDYKIVKIDSYEEAEKYGEYTKWCITRSGSNYDSYTHNGIGRFYFCLKNGFENIPKESGENCPLDEYGLSMIATSVNEDGSCNTITPRWNHDNGSNDHIMTPEELSDIIGMNYYEVFKPRTKEEIELIKRDFNKKIEEKIASGNDIKKIFNYVSEKYGDFGYEVSLNGLCNVLTTNNKILSDTWFEAVFIFDKRNTCNVRLNDKYNIMTKDGVMLSDTWFDDIYTFKNDSYKVSLNHKYNILTKEGKLLSPIWVDWVNFNKGCCELSLDGKYNILTMDGEFLSDTWLDSNELCALYDTLPNN